MPQDPKPTPGPARPTHRQDQQGGGLSRRGFLEGAAGAALVGSAGLATFCHDAPREAQGSGTRKDAALSGPEPRAADEIRPPPAGAKGRARVILVRDEKVLGPGRKVRGKVIARMLDDAVAALMDTEDAALAWSRLFVREDIVGIKTNVWRFLRTPVELEQAIQSRLMGLGITRDRIAIDDRGVLENPLFRQATALVNARPLRTHHWAGIGSCIKNHIMFSPRPYEWHDDACANLAGVWDLPLVKGKTRLNLLVVLTPLFHGKGPHHYNASYTWDYGGLILGTDPVAVDATGVRILEAKRRAHFGGDEPFAVSPKHVRVAETKYGLGIADPARIDLVKLGWQKDRLI